MRTARLLRSIGAVLMLMALTFPLANHSFRQSIANFFAATAPTRVSSSPGENVTRLPDPVPLLDQAKRIIPTNLTRIYTALNQGNLQAAQPYLSQQLANNYQALDQVCKPFTYRAHYIEAIIERPRGWFEVRARVLFQPMDERAYVLSFFMAQGGAFYLNEILEPTDDWFGVGKQVAAELARNFIYAAKAHRSVELARFVTPGIPVDAYATDACWNQFFTDAEEVRVSSVNLASYKGLKLAVEVDLSPAWGLGYHALGRGQFLVEEVKGVYKIVSADPRGTYRDFWLPQELQSLCQGERVFAKIDDPQLEERTLKRFGLPVGE